MPTELELAWAAGFIDGEGSICIASRVNANKGYSNYLLRFSAVQTVRKPLDKLHQMFGGHILYKNREGQERVTRKDYWQWDIVGKRAQAVLRQLLPYFQVKEAAATVGLVFPIGKTLKERCTPRHPLAVILQEECAKRLHEINRKGP